MPRALTNDVEVGDIAMMRFHFLRRLQCGGKDCRDIILQSAEQHDIALCGY